MKILESIKKYKIKAKKLYTIFFISIIEIIIILWFNNWVFTPAVFAPLIQLAMIFENRDVWARLTEKEKKDITLTETELDNFVRVIVEKLDYMTIDEILEEIKK